MMNISFLLMFLFLSGVWVYVTNQQHFLIMLLSLEVLVLSLFSLMFLYFGNFYFEYFFSMFYLSLTVCEGVLGLSLLVAIIRSHGGDSLFLFDNLW